MKKMALTITIVLLAFIAFATGCSKIDFNGNRNGDGATAEAISGTIYSIEENRILVISGLNDVNIPAANWFEQGFRAVYFAVDGETQVMLNDEQVGKERLLRGQEVDVYHEGFLAESYPEQGKALRVVITSDTPAEKEFIDSGRFAGINEEGLLMLKISGVPDELPARKYALTSEASDLLGQMELNAEEAILSRYLEDELSDGLVFDISRIIN